MAAVKTQVPITIEKFSDLKHINLKYKGSTVATVLRHGIFKDHEKEQENKKYTQIFGDPPRLCFI